MDERDEQTTPPGASHPGASKPPAAEATRQALDEARQAAAEAARKAAVAAREVGKEVKEGTSEALGEIREAAREAGDRARAASADILGKPGSPAAPSPGGSGASGAPPPPPAGEAAGAAADRAADASTPSSTGFDPNLAGALSYVFAPITGPLFFVMEKRSTFVRFHAMQAMLFAAAAIIIMTVLSIVGWIPLLGAALITLGGLGLFIVWLLVMWKALQCERYRLPFIGDIAAAQVNRPAKGP